MYANEMLQAIFYVEYRMKTHENIGNRKLYKHITLLFEIELLK